MTIYLCYSHKFLCKFVVFNNLSVADIKENGIKRICNCWFFKDSTTDRNLIYSQHIPTFLYASRKFRTIQFKKECTLGLISFLLKHLNTSLYDRMIDIYKRERFFLKCSFLFKCHTKYTLIFYFIFISVEQLLTVRIKRHVISKKVL